MDKGGQGEDVRNPRIQLLGQNTRHQAAPLDCDAPASQPLNTKLRGTACLSGMPFPASLLGGGRGLRMNRISPESGGVNPLSPADPTGMGGAEGEGVRAGP